MWTAIRRAVVLAAVGLAACSGGGGESHETKAMSIKPSEDLSAEALEILNAKCTVCHTSERFEARQFTAEEWNEVLERMVTKGARLSGDELDVLRHIRR
ncbi:hypothetical protein [Deferrisoma palaeochoriense]